MGPIHVIPLVFAAIAVHKAKKKHENGNVRHGHASSGTDACRAACRNSDGAWACRKCRRQARRSEGTEYLSPIHRRAILGRNPDLAAEAARAAVAARGYHDARLGYRSTIAVTLGEEAPQLVDRSVKSHRDDDDDPDDDDDDDEDDGHVDDDDDKYYGYSLPIRDTEDDVSAGLTDPGLEGLDFGLIEALYKRAIGSAYTDAEEGEESSSSILARSMDAVLDPNDGIATIPHLPGFESGEITGMWSDAKGEFHMPDLNGDKRHCWRPNGTVHGVSTGGGKSQLGEWMVDYGAGCANLAGSGQGANVIGRSVALAGAAAAIGGAAEIGGGAAGAGGNAWVWI